MPFATSSLQLPDQRFIDMQLNTIKPAEGSKKNRRRVGRGIGSSLGKTGGRGMNGQKSRSGYARRLASKAAKCRCNVVAEAWLHLADARLPRQKSPLARWPSSVLSKLTCWR